MITPAYVRLMARYNTEMNRRWYAAAARLTDGQLREDRGAFWGSVLGTLNHILWADRQWMSRFTDWPKPALTQKQSPTLFDDFAALHAARMQADADIVVWADGVTEDWLAEDLVWFSGSVQKELRRNRAPLVIHMFNHQTHHRGQAHALLSAFGVDTGDTDLPFVLPRALLEERP
jgi:uncharacterized damage-inducible protein DinB